MLRKPLLPASRRQRTMVVLGLVTAAASLSLWTRQLELTQPPVTVAPSLPYNEAVALASPASEPLDLQSMRLPRPFSLRSGQTPTGLLYELGVGDDEIRGAITALAEKVNLRKMRAGESGLAYYNPEGYLQNMRLRLDRRGWLSLERQASGWHTDLKEFVRTTHIRQIEGQLESALLIDIEKAGGRPQVAYAMSGVLQWDLDFNRDLRTGDRFQVVYEDVHLDGQFSGVGKVLAMSYENRGRRHEAYLFDDGETEGHYDAEGRPLQKMFLRSPLPFTRVTSKFSPRRFHPVLKKYRPHYGVDFGAPTGTPVRVTAHGSVVFAGTSGGAGRMVKVRHPNGYESAYLHLSRIGVRKGQRVRQGDTIGRVGSTGWSTGPHLDYRMKLNGRYIDPMKLQNQPAEPISQAQMAAFKANRDWLRGRFEPVSETREVRQAAAKPSQRPVVEQPSRSSR